MSTLGKTSKRDFLIAAYREVNSRQINSHLVRLHPDAANGRAGGQVDGREAARVHRLGRPLIDTVGFHVYQDAVDRVCADGYLSTRNVPLAENTNKWRGNVMPITWPKLRQVLYSSPGDWELDQDGRIVK